MNMVIQDGRRTYANRLNETPWKERLFMLFALIMFLHHIYTTVYFEVNNGVALFAAPWLLLALCNTVRGKLWKDPGAVFLFMLLAWKFVRLVPKGPDALKENAHVFFFCIYAFFGCYGLGKALKKESIQLFLKVFCAAWTISLLILCIMGIYVAWTGDEIANLGNKAVLIKENRLSMIYHWIEGGFLSSISLVVATIGFILCGKKAGKVFYVAAMAVIFLAGLLTMTRSAYAITAAEFAIILGILVHQRYKARASQNAEGKKRGWIRILAVIAASGIAMTGIQLIVVQEFNSLRNRVVINAEKADSTSENKQVETLTVRHIVNQKGVDMTLNGRTETWSNVFQVIRENPRILLWGRSMQNPMEPIAQLRESKGLFYVFHCHNVLLQTLLEVGLPGVILYLAFLTLFALPAKRLILNGNLPLWQRIIPVPVIGCILGELIDVTTYVNKGLPQMTLMYLFIGLTVALAAKGREAEKNGI